MNESLFPWTTTQEKKSMSRNKCSLQGIIFEQDTQAYMFFIQVQLELLSYPAHNWTYGKQTKITILYSEVVV